MLCLCHFLNNPIAHFYTGNTDASLVLLLFRVLCMQMVSFLLVETRFEVATPGGCHSHWLFTAHFFSPLNHLHLPPRLTPSLVLSKLHPSTLKDAGASRESWCFLFMQLQEPGRTQSTQPHTTLHTSTSVCSEGRDASKKKTIAC